MEPPHRSWILPGLIGLLTVPVAAAQRLVPIPLPSVTVPPGLLLVLTLAGIAALIARGSSYGWLGYGLGLAVGTASTLFAIASFTGSMSIIVENWLVSREVFRVHLALTVVLITTAAATGYATGALVRRRGARREADAPPALLAVALPVVAMVAVALGYPVIVPERALLADDAPTISIMVGADGRLTIDPTEFRAGQAIWEISSEFDRPLALSIVAIATGADLERLKAGAQQGFTFHELALALPGPGSHLKLETDPARYAIYAVEGGEGRDGVIDPDDPPSPLPIPPERLVVVDVLP
jgi:hypothetical protein